MRIAAWGHPYSEFPEGKDRPDDIKRMFERWASCGIERYIPFVSSRGTAYYESRRLTVDRDLLAPIVCAAKEVGIEVHPILGLGPMGAGSETRRYRVDLERHGITADDARIYVASFGGAEVWCLGREGKVEHRWKLPAQGLDGLVRLSDGTLLVSSWRASAVFRIAPDGTISKLFTKISAPADIGFDSKRKRVLIPWFNMNRVEARPLPGTATGGQTEEKIPAQKEGTAGKETVSLQPAPETRP